MAELGIENGEYLGALYEQYVKDPASVDSGWRSYFSGLGGGAPRTQVTMAESSIQCQVKDLVAAYRAYGHLAAFINPLENKPPVQPEQLCLSTFGLSEGDLKQEVPTFGVLPQHTVPLSLLIATLQKVYCQTVGYEFNCLGDRKKEEWIQQKVESANYHSDLTLDERRKILQFLNQSELFEVFLHTKFVGQKRFSLEGGESMIPVLRAIIEKGGALGGDEFYIGMAHRGRLNVLTNVLGKSYAEVFSEFDDAYIPDAFEGSGDVKYHKGFQSDLETGQGNKVKVILTPNPSHLESVDPVVEGMVRARQDRRNDIARERVIPVLIHGDAALAGQGVVYETLQMYKLNGYTTGGTIHVVINNQIGFTTQPSDGRSTLYCTDIAKGFGAPVFHVNGEDPEACVRAAKLAAEIRHQFHCDVFIDIICYRKFGHNEADEPAFTQPTSYGVIRKKRPVREIYRDFLVDKGLLEKKVVESLEQEFRNALQDDHDEIKSATKAVRKPSGVSVNGDSLFAHTMTGVPEETLKEIVEAMSKIPSDLAIHPKIAALTKDRQKMGEGAKQIDWGMGELMAYASLLWQGVNIRISGQDVCRGTFSHRHAMWMDQIKQEPYFPLKHLKDKQGNLSIYNSLLSEFAVLGFEFGYSVIQPESLVVWEAQFGDFANGAQVIIDQYISSAEQKWGQKVGLVMLLPHGYEGQGPEHSSGRIERFLTLAGNDNIQIVNCSSPAQLFHLLRRQVLRSIRKPLVVFTPKALLRHPLCVSTIEDFTHGSFMEVLEDVKAPEKTLRVAFCTGKIYYELIAEREKDPHYDLAIVRVEQLYPLDKKRVAELIGRYSSAEQFYWVQEEPENMGAWEYIHTPLQNLLPEGAALRYVGRPRSASSAAGSLSLHKNELSSLMLEVFPPKHPSIFDIASQHQSP